MADRRFAVDPLLRFLAVWMIAPTLLRSGGTVHVRATKP